MLTRDSENKDKSRNMRKYAIVVAKTEQNVSLIKFHEKYICIPKKNKQTKVHLNQVFLASMVVLEWIILFCGV